MNSDLIGFFDIIKYDDMITYARNHGIKNIKIEVNVNAAYSICVVTIQKTNFNSIVK